MNKNNKHRKLKRQARLRKATKRMILLAPRLGHINQITEHLDSRGRKHLHPNTRHRPL